MRIFTTMFKRAACVLCCLCALAYARSTPTLTAQALTASKQDPLGQSATTLLPTMTPESNLTQNSFFTHRYTTRFDKPNEIKVMGLYGESSVNAAASRYSGGAIAYDGIIDRYPLGAFVGYAYGQSLSPALASTQLLTLGIFSDVFIENHHIQAFAAQGFQASYTNKSEQSLASRLDDWIFASSTNALLSYGYVFVLGSSSFLETYARYNLHALFPISSQGSVMSPYMLRTNIDLGVLFTQFLGRHITLSLAPAFRQDVGVIGVDRLARPLVTSPNGELIIALPDSKYHSYGLLSLGLEWRATQTCTIALKAHGIYTNSAYLYSGNLGVRILF